MSGNIEQEKGRGSFDRNGRQRWLMCMSALVISTLLILGGASAAHTQESNPGAALWTSGGPGGGYINSIAIAPSNPVIVYVGTASGVYKSTDGGDNWSSAGLYGAGINVVQVHPTNPNIVYAGVGKIPGYEIGNDDGFYKSTDGGSTWIRKHVTWVTALAVDPNNHDTIFLGTKSGEIFRSDDGGDDWVLKHTETYSSILVAINSIVVDPENSLYIYVGTGIRGYIWHGNRGFLKSMDGGETWTGKHIGATTPWDYGYGVVVTPEGYSPQKLYIIAEGGSAVDYADALYMSTDKGETWIPLHLPDELEKRHVRTIHVDPVAPDWLYVGTTHPDYPLIICDYSESVWASASAGLPSAAPSSIAINPDEPNVGYTGYGEEKLYRSADGGSTWDKCNYGLNNSHINDIVVCPLSSSSALAAVDGFFRIQKTVNQGASWTDINPDTHLYDFSAIAIDRINKDKMFAGTVGYDWAVAGRVYRTEDGGENWVRVDAASYSGTVKDIWVHPTNSDIVLVLKEYRQDIMYDYYGGVRRSTDGGETWSQVRNWGWPTCLASDPNNPDIVYLSVERLGYVFRSLDAGATWEDISPAHEWWNVFDIVVDSDSNIYAATTDYEDNALGGIWKWDQSTWSHLVRFDETDATALAIDRRTNPTTLYAGTSDSGVFISQDGGESWAHFNAGLDVMNMTKLEMSSTSPKVLYAGTEYGGVWSISVEEGPPVQYDLTTSSTDGGEVTDPGEETSTHAAGTVVDLVAEADAGYRFEEWTGDTDEIDDVDSASTFITMWDDYDIAAVFEEVLELAIVTQQLPDGYVGMAYEETLEVFGGTPSYSWDWTAEEEGQALPPVLALDSQTGTISGTPTEEGTFDFTVEVTDDEDATATQALSITVRAEPQLGIEGETRQVNCDMLPGVTVTLYDEHDVEIASTESDEHGQYTLAVPEEGEYRVVASRAGFRSEEQDVSVTGPTTTIDFIAEYGLIPDDPDVFYVLDCIILWQYPEPPCALDVWRIMDVIVAWQYPILED